MPSLDQTTTQPTWLRRFFGQLPSGSTLPEASWRRRHIALLVLTWLHVVTIPMFALARGYDLTHALTEGSFLLPFALAGTLFTRYRKVAVTAVAIGLITASALVVHISGGYIEAHFHFFVMIVLLTLYEDWIPFLVAFAYVLLHHGIAGVINPEAVYNHGDAYAHPWKWAFIHAGFISAAGVGAVLNWRLNEEARERRLAQEVHYGQQLEQLNAELRTADQLKSNFLAMASHELRTPLTAISGFSSTMIRMWDQIDDAHKREYVEIIDGQGARLTRLVDDLLVLSRIESGNIETDPEPIDVREVIEQTVRDLGLSEIRIACDPEVRALADRDHLAQMLVNYVGNAVKYGSGPIELVAEVAGDEVRVAVCDGGSGVPEEFVSHLFDRFSQSNAHAATSGTGLGLSIVRGLAEAHGGRAWYEPNEPTGSRFVLSLPAAS